MKIFTPNTIISSTDVNANFVEATNRTKVGQFAVPSATGNQSITGLGFQPKSVMFFAMYGDADGGSSSTHYGYMNEDGTQLAYCSGVRITTTSKSGRYQDADKCIAMITWTTGGVQSISIAASYVSMDADGFTINWSLAGTGNTVMYMAVG